DSCAFIFKHVTREFGDSDLELTYGLPVIKLEKKISDTIFIKLKYTKLGDAYSFNGSLIKSN
ncbi:MAG TPA: hypothetical protein VHZ50_10675, partial [Puia sp.]|nr:hypothetical protein [Puia sp.]